MFFDASLELVHSIVPSLKNGLPEIKYFLHICNGQFRKLAFVFEMTCDTFIAL